MRRWYLPLLNGDPGIEKHFTFFIALVGWCYKITHTTKCIIRNRGDHAYPDLSNFYRDPEIEKMKWHSVDDSIRILFWRKEIIVTSGVFVGDSFHFPFESNFSRF